MSNPSTRNTSVMINIYEPTINRCIWVDFDHNKRRRRGLINLLDKMMKSGAIVGWRLIHVNEEQTNIGYY